MLMKCKLSQYAHMQLSAADFILSCPIRTLSILSSHALFKYNESLFVFVQTTSVDNKQYRYLAQRNHAHTYLPSMRFFIV